MMTALLITVVLSLCAGPAQPPKTTSWTVMIYGGVDSSAEAHLMPHLKSLRSLSRKNQVAEVLLLIDRLSDQARYKGVLGEDFSDTRLFRLNSGAWERIAGGDAFPEITLTSNYEANTGDPATLRKFIEFGKRFAPADHYLLLFFGHGDTRSVCPDASSPNADRREVDDPLYVAEMTSELAVEHSVDFAWFDVCSFGAIENAYQLRPDTGRFSANVMLASPSISDPLPMAKIFHKAGFLGRSSAAVPTDGMELGMIASRVIQDHLGWSLFKANEAWACYDLAAAEKSKRAVDRLAVALAQANCRDDVEQLRGVKRKLPTMNYLHRKKGFPRAWVVSPHFDLFDLARRIGGDDRFSGAVREAANEVMAAVDLLIIESRAGWSYRGFRPGKNGIYVVFPDGDATWGDKIQWSYFGWYHPDARLGNRYEFGQYAWCRDGATPGNAAVENWFELLDAWYDTVDGHGGANTYRW